MPSFNHSREDGPFAPCPLCAVEMMREACVRRLSTLAANLRWAGCLRMAFDRGFDAAWNESGEGHNGEYARFKVTTYEQMRERKYCDAHEDARKTGA